MKIKKHILSAFLVLAMFGIPFLTNAQWDVGPSSAPASFALPDQDPETVATNLINWLLRILTLLFVLAFIISGIMFITSGGNADQAERAKKFVTYSVIGVIVSLIGYIVIGFIDQILT
jgi:magnesium-transporting ATPase (P-type)